MQKFEKNLKLSKTKLFFFKNSKKNYFLLRISVNYCCWFLIIKIVTKILLFLCQHCNISQGKLLSYFCEMTFEFLVISFFLLLSLSEKISLSRVKFSATSESFLFLYFVEMTIYFYHSLSKNYDNKTECGKKIP